MKNISMSKKRIMELYASGNIERVDYSKKNLEYDSEIERLANEKIELAKQIPLMNKPAVIELSIAQYCDEVKSRMAQCEDFETYRKFFLDFVDHVVYYKNLVELHGYVTIQPTKEDEIETKIEYKVITEIEWSERFSEYRKKTNGTRISMMDFNSMVGQSRKMPKDRKSFF